jgi:hypothetical protein
LISAVQTLSEPNLKSNELTVLMYVDEVDTLAVAQADRDPNTNLLLKSPLDHLLSVVDEFREQPIFTILLSTQSHLQQMAPSRESMRSSRSADSLQNQPAPITETPFDLFPERIPHLALDLRTLSDPGFLSLFGRPL